jgi:type II secretory pathway pseudopilin PulG
MRAFTLIETILYLGIFGILSVGMLESFSSLQESIDRAQTKALLSQEGNFLQQKIAFELENNQDVIIEPLNYGEEVSNFHIATSGQAVSFSFTLSAPSSYGQLLSRSFAESSYIFP